MTADLADLLGEDRLLKPSEAAQLLNRSTKTMAQWRSQGRGPKWKTREGRIGYRLADIRGFIRGDASCGSTHEARS